MTKSNKILLGWLAFVFVTGHSLAICIYAFPEGYISPRIKNLASIYVHPVFEQTWSLFAPCPIHDTKLRVKYYFEDDSTDWIEPMASAYENHAIYRFSHHGELAVGESNLLFFIASDLAWKGISLYEPFPVDSSTVFTYTTSYWQTKSFIHASADYLFDKTPVRALAECTFRNVKTGESGTMVLPEFSWDKE